MASVADFGFIITLLLNHTLLEVLPSNISMNGSSHTTVGQGTDQIYALYYCTGDVSLQVCHDCVQLAAVTLLEEEEPHFLHYNYTASLATLHQYQSTFTSMMNVLIRQAAYGSNNSVVGYATKKEELSGSEFILWGLVQCSPDIIGVGCDTCLRSAINRMDGWKTTIMFLASCNLRFGLFPSGSPPTSGTGGSIWRNVKFIVPLSIGLLAGVLLLIWLIKHLIPLIIQSTNLPDI